MRYGRSTKKNPNCKEHAGVQRFSSASDLHRHLSHIVSSGWGSVFLMGFDVQRESAALARRQVRRRFLNLEEGRPELVFHVLGHHWKSSIGSIKWAWLYFQHLWVAKEWIPGCITNARMHVLCSTPEGRRAS